MSFIAIFLALLLEQARPLGENNPMHAGIRAWTGWVRRSFDAGQKGHGWLSWTMGAALPALASSVIYWLLLEWSLLLALLWLVLVLYATLGFRQFSHHFTAIRDALEEGDEPRARDLLAKWQEVDVNDLPRQEVLRHVIEHSVLAAHRHVFGVLVAFAVFAWLGLGPAGAVLYRCAEYLARAWQSRGEEVCSEALQQAAGRAWQVLDHVPSRMTALSFAVVGNFEEAVACWRQDASGPQVSNEAVVLAATAGAINVRLGGKPLGGVSLPEEAELSTPTDGREPQMAHLASVVGLVWRSVVLWLLLLALMLLASWLG
ncbi:MAG TPA: CobD/CbiB family protein [Macromonas sp.]|nr:CobD/CbiB family protein [Macromonas sp.]